MKTPEYRFNGIVNVRTYALSYHGNLMEVSVAADGSLARYSVLPAEALLKLERQQVAAAFCRGRRDIQQARSLRPQ